MATAAIKIEKNIPIPTRSNIGMAEALRKLNVGDSILLSIDQRASVRPTAYRLGLRIAVRTLNDAQIRVWRTE